MSDIIEEIKMAKEILFEYLLGEMKELYEIDRKILDIEKMVFGNNYFSSHDYKNKLLHLNTKDFPNTLSLFSEIKCNRFMLQEISYNNDSIDKYITIHIKYIKDDGKECGSLQTFKINKNSPLINLIKFKNALPEIRKILHIYKERLENEVREMIENYLTDEVKSKVMEKKLEEL